MDFENLIALIRSNNPAAISAARTAGPGLSDALAEILRDPSDDIRSLALQTLAESKDPKSMNQAVLMLEDSNEQIRSHACNALYKHLPKGEEKSLLKLWDDSKDDYLRQHIPLVLGLCENRQFNIALNNRLMSLGEEGAEREARDSVIGALAKNGVDRGKDELKKIITDAEGMRIKDVLTIVRYVDQSWLVPELVPLLDRTEVAIHHQTHALEFTRRGCDLTTDEIFRLGKPKLSFEMDLAANYKPDQIAEIRKFAKR